MKRPPILCRCGRIYDSTVGTMMHAAKMVNPWSANKALMLSLASTRNSGVGFADDITPAPAVNLAGGARAV